MSLFRRRAQVERLRAQIPAGQRIFVFGDLHGRSDLLDRMYDAIARYEPRDDITSTIIGLGDYIDRGPDSRGVVQRLIDGIGYSTICLRGNHEQVLLDFIEEPAKNGANWLWLGGAETLRSYLDPGQPWPLIEGDHSALRDKLVRAIPPSHLLFFQSLPLYHIEGDYFFVHAGARAGRPLDRQSDHDLLWIRNGFADRDDPFDKVIVHGHTPVPQPYLGKFRINLDTGAYVSNRLSCLVLEGDRRSLIQI